MKANTYQFPVYMVIKKNLKLKKQTLYELVSASVINKTVC